MGIKIEHEKVEQATGELFGRLFPTYDDTSFRQSVELFSRRFQANDFPMDWFKGKTILDVGCGGGRYSIALALLEANKVIGVDVSRASIADAQRRAQNLSQVEFKLASAADLPFPNESFDGVICSGVIHHVAHPTKVVTEIARVLRPGGMLYLLVYASEGVRWPMVQLLRPIVQTISIEALEQAVKEVGLPVNKRRTYLDDLLVPIIDFYSWERLSSLIERNGFKPYQRWERGRLDHEEDLEAYRADLAGFADIFHTGAKSGTELLRQYQACFQIAQDIAHAVVEVVGQAQNEVTNGIIPIEAAMRRIVGQGHHRVIAWKSE